MVYTVYRLVGTRFYKVFGVIITLYKQPSIIGNQKYLCFYHRPENSGFVTAKKQPESTRFVTLTAQQLRYEFHRPEDLGFVTAEKQPNSTGFCH